MSEGETKDSRLDPDWMHRIPDSTDASLHNLIRRLRMSSSPEHALYREAELDDLWRHAEASLHEAEGSSDRTKTTAAKTFEAAFEAHNLAGNGELDSAAQVLEGLLRSRQDSPS